MLSQDSRRRLRDPSINRLVVALSGGMDSVSLLHTLAFSTDIPRPLVALHVNHRLQASAEDLEACCRSVCAAWSVPLLSRQVTVKRTGSLETNARAARYDAFRAEIQEGDLLLLAHHLDDQLETALFRLFRGSRLTGLQGMPHERKLGRGILLRPLLDVPRAEIRAYAKRHRLAFVEDPSNRELQHDRNWIRHELIPGLQQRWPNVKKTMLKTMERDSALHRQQILRCRRDLCRIRAGDNCLSLDALRDIADKDSMAASRLIDVWLTDLQAPVPSAGALKELTGRFLSNPRGAITSGDIEFRSHDNRLYVLRRLPEPGEAGQIPRFAEGRAQLPWGEISTELSPGEGLKQSLPYRFALRSGGEKMHRGRTRTLNTLFREIDMPPWLRGRVPLVVLDGKVIAIAAIPGWGLPMVIADGHGVGSKEAGLKTSLLLRDRLDFCPN